RLSPAVRTLADEHGIGDDELGKVQGTGVGGRISKRDLQDYIERRGTGAGKAPAVQAPLPRPAPGMRSSPSVPSGGRSPPTW
ncbi:MAG TPA: E3 binding domain-containing protein, partial [Candidatus Dormibacteraeota bacterium]|nr:E3 binding domain-containing protein [Candidatus Dormibacteraeota bacterium]